MDSRDTRRPGVTYVYGDATAPVGPDPKIIAHVCNDAGAWGSGFVLAVARQWPEVETAYRQWFAERGSNNFRLGAVQLVRVRPQLFVANMIAQVGPSTSGPPIRYDALHTCLLRVGDTAMALRASVHMPKIGTGLAGGDWRTVEPIVRRALGVRAPVRVYVPPTAALRGDRGPRTA